PRRRHEDDPLDTRALHALEHQVLGDRVGLLRLVGAAGRPRSVGGVGTPDVNLRVDDEQARESVASCCRAVKWSGGFCCCYMKMSGGNCHVKRSSPYGDLHVEPKGTASPRAAQGPLCGPGDHTAGCERAGGEPSPDPAAAAAV